MRHEILALSLAMVALPVLAQAPSASATAVPKLAESTGISRLAGREQLTERIIIEDGGARISELRFGGETRSITVQPKGGMPAYDVRPNSGADTQGTSGGRTWKIFGF